MRIAKFGCMGYKPFRERVDITLHPLTIFFGRIGSGKTVILRLPGVRLRAPLARLRSGFPLDVEELRFGESFRDLAYLRLVQVNLRMCRLIQPERV